VTGAGGKPCLVQGKWAKTFTTIRLMERILVLPLEADGNIGSR